MTSSFPRRTVLAGFFCLAAVPALGQATPLASVSVDVSRLRALGVGPAADLVESSLKDELGRLYGGRIGGRGPRLVVRITGLHITAFASGGGHRGSSSDSLDGEVLVLGARGEVLARYPQLAAVPAFGSPTDPFSEPRRVERVARAYAQWISRKVL